MVYINRDTSFKLDGKTDLDFNSGGYVQWSHLAGTRSWIENLHVFPAGNVKGLKVNLTFTGSFWEVWTLRFNNGGEFAVTINDQVGATGAYIEYLNLSHGPSTVKLNNTSVTFLNAGRGNDKLTLGASYVGMARLGQGDNTVKTGSGWVDAITAREGNDVATIGSGGVGSIDLGHGDNKVTTTTGWVDSIVTRSGKDTIVTGTGGVSQVSTGDGDDTVTVGPGGVGFVSLSGGDDTLILKKLKDADQVVGASGGAGSDTVSFAAFGKALTVDLSTSAPVDTGNGLFMLSKFENVIGTAKNDTIIGNSVDNVLNGGRGNDKLTGGAGADDLTGAAGRDIFIFTSVKDSTVAEAGRDTIRDFTRKQKDKIDLSAIDAKSKSKPDDAFKFVGTKAFSKKAGELRYEKQDGATFIYGDVDGNGKADFSIKLVGEIDLIEKDFIL